LDEIVEALAPGGPGIGVADDREDRDLVQRPAGVPAAPLAPDLLAVENDLPNLERHLTPTLLLAG
jgi:hypothetical protein